MTVFNSRASSGLKGASLPETKSPNAGPLFRASENFVARRGVEFVAFGDEGVISDAAVARHRVYRRGAYVVDERIRREAGRSEAMMCVCCSEQGKGGGWIVLGAGNNLSSIVRLGP
jgi:hypothetical protein